MLRAVLVIGLMSGTSADAVDAALVDWPGGSEPRPFALRAFREIPLGPALQARIHALAAGRVPGEEALAELAELDVLLGRRFAAAAQAVAEQAGVPLGEVAGIASHGQTVAHHPERRATLQIGDPSVIAEITGCTVVADFRPRDVAAGGEGAPLTPFFHHAVMSDARESRLVLNLGGIANVSFLPAGGDPAQVVAFDVGPANALLDGVVSTWSGGALRFDRGGAMGAAGRVDEALLQELLADPYLERPPPKSTGRERYGLAQAEALVAASREAGRCLADLLATLLQLNAEALGLSCERFLGGTPERLLVGGGGIHNRAQLAALHARLPDACIEPCDALGIPADAVEAMAFSLLGRNALLGLPNHLPHTTGARGVRILGEIVPGDPGRRGLALRGC